jgi:hypothetical protein
MHLFNLDIAEKQKDAQLITEKFISGLKDGSIEPKLKDTPEGSKYVLTFKNDPTFELAFPNIGNSVFSVEGLILSLLKFNEEHPTKIKQMTSVLSKTPSKRTILVKPLKSHQTRVVYKTFKEHMSKLGVEVKTYKGAIDEHGYVDNGIIYLNENSDITTTPMHELLHLVFGVMKHDSFESYERVLELTYKSDYAKELYRQLSTNDNYKNLMDLDLKEEVFCRLIEAIVDPNNDLTVE